MNGNNVDTVNEVVVDTVNEVVDDFGAQLQNAAKNEIYWKIN